ncbi:MULTISPECIES: phage baseplate protein [Empedobacter]|uniref:phage baseplate protein n=1 Tax=Empedobacter TaxID=59734 RepID=UPI00257548B7|nr:MULTISPECIES: hypothetical protein [Empedobacter]MDM1042121.1 hypothetical protein [Empedobacter brevis]MDM1136004.1 hypothetical protein [Empedobacter sp. R750]
MNRINIQQTGGFPLETDTLNAMQNAYDIFNSLGNIIAPLAIIKGCEILGNSVANGVVYINGEVVEFRGGQAGATVIIREETQNKNFENGENKLVYRTRYATFGSSVQTTNYNWTDFHRPMSIKEIQKRLMPVGCIVLDYYGKIEDIPAGYQLCDGTNGTPDLRGMFIVGYDPENADYKTIGNTGGAKEVTLTTDQMPKHKHSGSTSTDGEHAHSYTAVTYGGNNNFNRGSNGQDYNGTTSRSGNHSHTFETNEVGGSQAHENRPPFYVLAKIMYKG